MRGGLAFALTALTLLFLIEGLTVLLATVYSGTSSALYPHVRPGPLVLAVLPLVALFAPALPVARLVDRHAAIAAAAVFTAVVRVPMSVPDHNARMFVAALVVAAGAVFLSTAVGFLERRSVAGGVGAAVVLDQLMRLAGWSWDLTLRSWWVYPQLLVSAVVIAVAIVWVRMPMPGPADTEPSFERRAGGLRLRGAVGLALLLFLDLNVLARAEVATRWLGVPYEAAAVLLVTAGMAATLLLLAGHGPVGRHRPAALTLAGLVALAVLTARVVGGWSGLALLATGHAAAVLLLGRVLVPAGGRRKGGALVAGLICWLAFNAMYTASFVGQWSIPGPVPGAAWLFVAATLMLTLVLMLLPRPIQTRPPLRGRLYIGLALLLVVSAASLLAIRERPEPPEAAPGRTLRVATVDVRHGFDDQLRYDPAAIAGAIRAADADVVALQNVGMLPIAYGTDLAHYLGSKLGLAVHFAPVRNGLAGDAVLSRVRTTGFSATPLDGGGVLARLRMPAGTDTLTVLTTRLGSSVPAREERAHDVLQDAGAGPVVLLGDYPRRSGGQWVWGRGVEVVGAAVTYAGDVRSGTHPVLTAAIRLRPPTP